MDDLDSEWRRKGATLSDKTVQEEFGLTGEEIVRAVRSGKLHCQQQSMHGNPWLRLLRREMDRHRSAQSVGLTGCRQSEFARVLRRQPPGAVTGAGGQEY
jgi:hypothetical protein